MENEDNNFEEEEPDTTQKPVKSRTLLAFGVISFLFDFTASINVGASQDILEATEKNTSLVLLALSAPALLVGVTYPFFFQRIPVSVACGACFTFSVAGLLITSLVDDPRLKLIGVCLTSFGLGGTDTVFNSLTSLYGKDAINSFAVGSGISLAVGPLFYAGLTMLACFSPQVSLLLTAPLWILLPISYTAVKKPDNSDRHPSTFKEIPYSPIDEHSTSDSSEPRLSCYEMVSLVWQTQPLFIAVAVGLFSKYIILNGVVTTIAFSNISITPRNQYLIYVVVSGLGDAIGRSYRAFLSNFGIEDKCIVKKTWKIAVLDFLIVVLTVLISWFRFQFLYNLYSALTLVFLSALLQGIIYVNSFQVAGEGLGVPERSFCRSLLTGAIEVGIMSSALMGLDTESKLREHCVQVFDELTCFTRSPTAWEPSVSCVL